MRVLILTIALLVSTCTVSFAGMSYECARYINGEWQGYTNVVANSKEEAERLAFIKFTEELKLKFDSIKCK